MPKPRELRDIRPELKDAFDRIKQEWAVPDIYELRLHNIDEPGAGVLRSVDDVAAINLRRLQALRFMASEDARVRNDVLIGQIAQLHYSLEVLANRAKDEWVGASLLVLQEKLDNIGRVVAQSSGGSLVVLE